MLCSVTKKFSLRNIKWKLGFSLVLNLQNIFVIPLQIFVWLNSQEYVTTVKETVAFQIVKQALNFL